GLTSSGSVPQFEASAGGLLDLHALVQVPDGSVQFIASDPGSEIVLSALTTLTTSFSSSLEAHNGGMVVCPLVTIVSGNLTLVLDGAASSINTAQLRDIDGVTVYARNGATLDLSGVTTFSPQIPSLPDVEVSGNGSAINLSNLTEMHGPQNGSTAQFAALAGGRLDLHQLARIPDGSVQFVATGANSQIDASGLATFAVTGFGTGFLSVVQATDGGSIDLGSGTTTLSNVEVTLSPSGTLTAGTLVLASGSQLDGSGTLTGNLTNGGVVAPGTHDVTGVITVSGNYVQTAAGTLNVGFDDTGTAVSVDQLIVGGSATLAGTLDLSLLGGFKPSPGNTFTIVSFAFANGTFASVSGTDAGNGHTFAVSYGPLEVKLQVE
ncbi:MAG TPA: hypothetical protein VGX76_05890, partial [Pirellulales bacterium]|nr:hypothetical protein [Pirellulales bacterium]